MPLSDNDVRAAALAQLTSDQLRSSIVYLASGMIAKGTRLAFPRVTIQMPWDGFLAFIDLDPMANWTHPSRYVCIQQDSGDTKTIEANLPPFGARTNPSLRWQELYRAPDVPAAVGAIPHPSSAGK
ncbi:MAG: hypothetical protein C5B58_00975 [Acidobacteria bacterium]|nr:MAG: hypothetical protein C5B58_00975 [Acidobacteriota bacterium]